MKQFLFVLTICIFITPFIFGQDKSDGYITISIEEYELGAYEDLKSELEKNAKENSDIILINSSEFAGEQEKELKDLVKNHAADEIVLSFEEKTEKVKSKESFRIKYLTKQVELYNLMLLKAKDKSFGKKENIGYDVSPYKNNFFDLSLAIGYSYYTPYRSYTYVSGTMYMPQHGAIVGFEFGYNRAVNEYCALGASLQVGFDVPSIYNNTYVIPEFNLMIGHLPSNIAGIFNIGVGFGFGFQFGIYLFGFTFKMGYALPGTTMIGKPQDAHNLTFAIGYKINWASKKKI